MSYITKSMTIIITLYSVSWGKPHTQKTREVYIKNQGVVQGTVEPLRNHSLSPVEVYLGIPYAAPPVGEFRFMPPTSNMYSWDGAKHMNVMGPVCPQKFPDESTMTSARRRYVNRLQKYLQHENEDCLYLNIYAPYQVSNTTLRLYPVIVFLHGESFEWNSGNPYDGSVLASFGQVVVVTMNFRLGILGFLKVEAGDTSHLSNLGLVDQMAALVWIRENIKAFGGDPGKVTLMGHGTGAVFASLLTINPMAIDKESIPLFHRAILMSGTALADWALVSKPLDVSIQVAQSLNCPLDNLTDCLRKKRLDELMETTPITEPYKTTFGPVIDNLKVPNEPKKLMMQYTNMFRRFELMYGVTELESVHLPFGGDVALIYGMLENERDAELQKYMRARCEMKQAACFAQTRARYNYNQQSFQRDQDVGRQPDRATLARDELLDILSDARTVAPVIQAGIYHSVLNFQSYFYVFAHKTHSKEYIRNKTYNGEELPYVFGVPIEGPKFHFEYVAYTEDEKRLSMTVMRYISNFANTGNPEVPRMDYSRMDYSKWRQFDREWIQFDKFDQNYIKLGIPITNERFYRKAQMDYWNEVFPNISKNPLPWNNYKDKPDVYENFSTTDFVYGIPRDFGFRNGNDASRKQTFGHVITAPPAEGVKQSSSTVSVLVFVGALFLFANLAFFTFLYFKCIKNRKQSTTNVADVQAEESTAGDSNNVLSNCNILKILSKPQGKNEDTYDAVHPETKSVSKMKLTRAMSNSTIDAHAKVREWITNEIVLKYSPKNDRKIENMCPTRPVSPLLIKTASIDRSNRRKRADKVSVAIDATPTGRGPSVLMQQPIELTKAPLRRSLTLEDFSSTKPDASPNALRKSITSIDLKSVETEPIIIRIEHGHSKSDPVQDVDYNAIKRLKTFDPNNDVNVTSRDDNMVVTPLTPEEALMTIKRRNFPKVLPDHPGRQAFLSKRRSMPVHSLYAPISESQQQLEYSNSEPYSPTGRNFIRFPPVPPPRTTTLGRQGSNPQPVCLSEPMLAEEPPASPEPEVTCNNLYVGPLIPKTDARTIPRAIISANPNSPIKRLDPKVVVKPTISKTKSNGGKHIPRVVVPDNRPEIYAKPDKKSQIPTLIKTSNPSLNKETSSSSSGDSDTGTVVKRV